MKNLTSPIVEARCCCCCSGLGALGGMLSKRIVFCFISVAVAIILFPSKEQEAQRFLKAELDVHHDRVHETYRRRTICSAGQEPFALDWTSFVSNAEEQTLQVTTDQIVSVKVSKTKEGLLDSWSNEGTNGLQFTAGTAMLQENTIVPPSPVYSTGLQHADIPQFPPGFGTMELKFVPPVHDLSFTLADMGSDTLFSKVLRVRVFNTDQQLVNLTWVPQGDVVVVKDFSYQPHIDRDTGSAWIQADGKVKRVLIDYSLFGFYISGGTAKAKIKIANVSFCPSLSATDLKLLRQQQSIQQSQQQPKQQTPSNNTLFDKVTMMSITGNKVEFHGRSDSWYSAISTKSFQWNAKVQKLKCLEDGDTFLTGSGFTIFNDEGKPIHRIQIVSVNSYNTNTECGTSVDDASNFDCLAAGSLALLVDGRKISKSVDQTIDEDLRIVAFNTVARCSSPWFRLTKVTPSQNMEFHRRNLTMQELYGPSITESCMPWVSERQARDDLLRQTGTWSTVLILTDKVSFRIEHRQGEERCNQYDLSVWVSHVKHDVFFEEWKGIIGETKDPASVQQLHKSIETSQGYELVSPFSLQCSEGCIDRQDPRTAIK